MYMRHREEEGSHETKEEEMVPCFRLPYLWESEFCCANWCMGVSGMLVFSFQVLHRVSILWSGWWKIPLVASPVNGREPRDKVQGILKALLANFGVVWKSCIWIHVKYGLPCIMSTWNALCLVGQQKPWIGLCPEGWAEILMVASHPIYFSYLGHYRNILEGKSRQWLVNCKKFWFGEMSLSFKLTWQLLALPQLCPVAVSSNHKLLTQNWVWEIYYVVELCGK
jgi:hypothetical protein